MEELTISGSSDDLICFDGVIYDESNVYNTDRPLDVLLSTGTHLKVLYTEPGLWKITVMTLGNANLKEHFQATDPAGNDYSDRVTLTGTFAWAVVTDKMHFKNNEKGQIKATTN